MDSAVRSRPNHYETLGLSPKASGDEIARAFAREVSSLRPRPFGGVAHVSIAYETLRDPVKRQAYDAALGFNQEPQPRPTFSTWRIGAHFMETASVGPSKRAEADETPPLAPALVAPPSSPPAPPPAQHVAPEPLFTPEPKVASAPLPEEPRLPSFLAAALREPPSPDDSRSFPPVPMESALRPPKPDLGDLLAIPRAQIDSPDLELDEAPIEWQRGALAVGGVVLAVAFLAAIAGWSAGLAEEPQAVEPVATTALPAANSTQQGNAADSPVEAWSVENARPAQASRSAKAVARVERPATPPLAAPAEQQAEAAPTGRSLELIAEQTIAQMPPAAAATVQASLPLPNAVVARTIGRIGYSCGQVASTAPVGGSGVFKVTCTSGQSYRAAPVRGRYRFSRWGGQ